MPTGLFVFGGAAPGGAAAWVGVATSDLNMAAWEIIGVNTITILQTAVTGCAIDVSRNLAAANTDSPIVCIEQVNAADDQVTVMITNASPTPALYIDQNNNTGGTGALDIENTGNVSMAVRVVSGMDGTAAAPLVLFETTNAAFDEAVLHIIQDGTAEGLYVEGNANAASVDPLVLFETTNAAYDQAVLHIIQDGTGGGMILDVTLAGGGIGIEVDQDADNYGIVITSAATTNTFYALQVLTGAGATVANFQYTGAEFARLGMHNDANGTNWFFRNLAAADTAGPVVTIEQSHADDDQGALYVVTDSDASAANALVHLEITDGANDQPALEITQPGVGYGILVNMSAGAGAGAYAFRMNITDAAFTQTAMYIENLGSGRTAQFNGRGTGAVSCIVIDHNGNNAADIWGLEIDCENAGGGVPGAIKMTGMSAGEALFGVPVDTGAVGATYGRITVYVNGVGLKAIELQEIA